MVSRERARAELARRSLADFARQAIAAGVVDGIKRVRWGKHLDKYCDSLQFQIEGWLVSHGPDRDAEAWQTWADAHDRMIARQHEAWERTCATWEDGDPEPWLRYVLVQNEVDNLPPATLKSTLAMVIACAWVWLWEPNFAFGALSGIDANVDRDSKATRDLVKSKWYRELFAVTWSTADLEDASTLAVKRDSDAVSDWATTAGGKRRSRTISSGLTGSHVDGIFLDDPDDADKVWSEAERVKPQNRWTRAAENRVNCEKRSIRRVLQQRTHIDDFTAYLLSTSRWSPRNTRGWVWFCLPAEYGYGPEDAPAETPYGKVDWRTKKGETLHEALSPGVLATAKDRNPAGYEAQYNQNPGRVTDGWFHRRLARFFVFDGETVTRRRPDNCPQRIDVPAVIVKRSELDRWTLSVDAANSLDPDPKGKTSAVGLVIGACRGDERLVVDDRTRVLGVGGTYLAIYELIGAWPLSRILVELKALGAGVITEISMAIRRGWYTHPDTDQQVELTGPDGQRPRCTVEPFNPGKDSKPQRHHAMLPDWQRGAILLRDGADWLYSQSDDNRRIVDEGFVGEICSVPHSRRTDRADALSQFVAHYRTTQDAKERWKAMARLRAVR